MGLPNSYHPHSARVIHQIIRGNLVTFKFFLVFLSKLGTLLLDSLGGKGKNMTSLACLRNAGSYSTVTYCNTFKFKTCEEISILAYSPDEIQEFKMHRSAHRSAKDSTGILVVL